MKRLSDGFPRPPLTHVGRHRHALRRRLGRLPIVCKAACFLAVLAAAFLRPEASSAQSMHETIETVLPRVVKIYGAGGLHNLEAYGTGILVSPEGHVATVWSHVLDSDFVNVVLNSGRRFRAEVLGAEPQLDLAILKLEGEHLDLPYFDVDDAASAGTGVRILGFSNMFNVAAGDEPVSVVHGVIAAHTELSTRRGAFEMPYDGPVYVVDGITNNSGAAGGVITTRDGRLLGMIGRELRNATTNTWVNYAVPITELSETIKQIISGDYTSKPKDRDAEENPRRYHPYDFGLVLVPDVLYRTPAYVDQVLPGSPAAEAGIQADDLVLFINNELVQSVRTFRDEVGRLDAGDTLRLVVRRGNALVTAEMPVVKKEAPDNAP